MKKIRFKWTALTLALCIFLSGCVFRPVDQLYAIPHPTKDYEALQQRLGEVVAQGGEYAAPLTGEMIQAVQLQDLDGDGKQEAIAFFRFPGEEKPMKIYIFRQNGDSYETLAVVEGAATAVNRVDYAQMDDEPFKEIVVSWQMTAQVHSLAAYSIGPEQVEEMIRTDYDDYALCDLDQDNQQEIVAFRTPITGQPQAELYDFDGVLALAGTAPLSTGAVIGADGRVKTDYLTGVITGRLSDRVPAVFATSSYGENGRITDVFVSLDGQLRNVTLDPETGESGETVSYYSAVGARDINGDGVTEIPQPVPVVDVRNISDTVSFWLIRWRQFDANGGEQPVFTTYHNERDGWYFIIPDEWDGKLSLSRSDLPGGGERAVTFSRREGAEWEEARPFLTIYRLTGSNRMSRAAEEGRFILIPPNPGDDVVYAARFREGWSCGLTEDQVRERFAIIKTDWYSGY